MPSREVYFLGQLPRSVLHKSPWEVVMKPVHLEKQLYQVHLEFVDTCLLPCWYDQKQVSRVEKVTVMPIQGNSLEVSEVSEVGRTLQLFISDSEFLNRWVSVNWIGYSSFSKDFVSQIERSAEECVVDKFMTQPCRMHPINFNIPANRGWRPYMVPIVISDDEDTLAIGSTCVDPPDYSVTKVTRPTTSGQTAGPQSKYLPGLGIPRSKSFILINLSFLAQIFMSFTDRYRRQYGPIPLQNKPESKCVFCKIRYLLFCFVSANPLILLRDVLLYPSPLDPFGSSGYLRRQTTTCGSIEKVGKF